MRKQWEGEGEQVSKDLAPTPPHLPKLRLGPFLSPKGRGKLAFYFGEIRHCQCRGADAVEEFQAVFSEGGIVGVHRDLVEEGIDGAAQLGDGRHGGGKILVLDGLAGVGFGGGDGAVQVALLALDEELRIGQAGEAVAILLLLDPENVGGALDASKKILAVIAVEEFGSASKRRTIIRRSSCPPSENTASIRS